MKQIKVNNTRMHTAKVRMFDTKHPDSSSKNVEILATEAKLVLVECEWSEALFYRHHNQVEFDPNSNSLMLYSSSTGKVKGIGKYFKPILISETEKIEVGDLVWNSHNLFVAGHLTKDDFNCKKVLALPEHFSPKHLQAIVDSKLKDGGKVLVECDTLESLPPKFVIQLNTSNHITLHKIEEKMYTEAEVYQKLNAYAVYLAQTSTTPTIAPLQEWWYNNK